MPRNKDWIGRVYLGRDSRGRQQFWWVGRFPTKRERDAAVAEARKTRPWEQAPSKPASEITCDEWAARYLARYERLVRDGQRKESSLDTARGSLKAFRAEFGSLPVASVTPIEAEDWASTVPKSSVPQVVALMNYAKRMQVIAANPFDGLGGGRGRGRRDQAPPTLKQLDLLRDACDVLGAYAQQMRDLVDFAAYTLMRPSELYELRHTDADLVANRIAVDRRYYRGKVDTPKTGEKTIALVPPARVILLRQPTRTREDGLVFVSKLGRQLTASTVCQYWALVNARAGLDFDFYAATKHYGCHRLYKLGLSKRAIAAQAGWSEREVDAMLRVYGHADLVALAEVDELYAGESDATVTHKPPTSA